MNTKLTQKVPGLLGLMDAVLNKLEKQPVTIEIAGAREDRKTRITIDKFALQWLTAAFISRRDFLATMPALYYSISKDDLSLLTSLMQRIARRPPLPATQYTMRCASGVSRQRYETIKREAAMTLLGNAVNFPWPGNL